MYYIIKIKDSYNYIKANDFYAAVDFIRTYFEFEGTINQEENFYKVEFEDIPLNEIIIHV